MITYTRLKTPKKDEFYTQLGDIENELRHYRHHFKDKVVYCNCDDPRISNFFHYFSYNFEDLGLKKLITTCYQNQKREIYEAQQGICPACKEHFDIAQMEADHITPWHKGGKTELNNGQMLCKECNRKNHSK